MKKDSVKIDVGTRLAEPKRTCWVELAADDTVWMIRLKMTSLASELVILMSNPEQWVHDQFVRDNEPDFGSKIYWKFDKMFDNPQKKLVDTSVENESKPPIEIIFHYNLKPSEKEFYVQGINGQNIINVYLPRFKVSDIVNEPKGAITLIPDGFIRPAPEEVRVALFDTEKFAIAHYEPKSKKTETVIKELSATIVDPSYFSTVMTEAVKVEGFQPIVQSLNTTGRNTGGYHSQKQALRVRFDFDRDSRLGVTKNDLRIVYILRRTPKKSAMGANTLSLVGQSPCIKLAGTYTLKLIDGEWVAVVSINNVEYIVW